MKKLLLAALMLLTFSSISQAASAQPVMTITDIHGVAHQITGTQEGFKIKGLEGKIVFLEFFGHRCPPCLASIPHLIDLQKRYKEKLAVISIEVQGLAEAQLKQFVQTKGMNYIVVSNEKAGIFTNYVAQRAQWRGSIPFMIALDKKGNVQFVQAGMLPEATLDTLVKQIDALQ